MKSKKAKESLWNFFFAGLFLATGAVCIWLDHHFPAYSISMTAWGAGWLVLAAIMAGLTLREYRREVPRDLQPLAVGLAYVLLAVASWERGLRAGSGFYVATGICWMALAAAWLVRAVRQLWFLNGQKSGRTNKEEQ